MSWIYIAVLSAIYFVIGSWLSNTFSKDDDVAAMGIFITWPLIIGAFLVVAIMMLIYGIVYLAITLLKTLIDFIHNGGDSHGVV